MSVKLVLGSPSTGKTAAAVDRLVARYSGDPFAPTLVIVPTVRHADQFRRRLVARSRVAVGLDVLSLGTLTARALAESGPIPTAVADELLRRVTRREIADGAASYFHPISETPGLATLVGHAITELIDEAVDPVALQRTTGELASPHLTALSAIYSSYLEDLDERRWLHSAAAPRAAATRVEEGQVDLPDLVVVDGFQFFRGGELALIEALASRAELLVTIDPAAGARSADSAARLRALLPDLTVTKLPPRSLHVESRASIASDKEAELRSIAREIKERLAANPELRPSDFAVALRQATPYLPLARAVFGEYDLPFDPAAADRLGTLPLGRWLLRLLRIGHHGWRLDDLQAVLSSGFVDRSRWNLSRDHVALIVRHGRRNNLWSGRDALERIASGLHADADRPTDNQPRADRLHRAADALSAVLAELGEHVEPAAGTTGSFARDLDGWLFADRPLVRAASAESPSVGVEVDTLRRELQSLRAVEAALGGETISFEQFVDQLEARLENAAVVVREAGGVLFAPMHTLHGLRFEYLAVGGMNEGEFPAARHRPELLDAPARVRLAEAGLELPPEPRARSKSYGRRHGPEPTACSAHGAHGPTSKAGRVPLPTTSTR